MPPLDLRPSERPMQSSYGNDAGRYARRRTVTVLVLLGLIGWGAHALWPHRPRNPADIPTVLAGPPVKDRPAQPGGIDIPHQDVEVYNEISGGNQAAPVEHLLPPPENPDEALPASPPAAALSPDEVAAAGKAGTPVFPEDKESAISPLIATATPATPLDAGMASIPVPTTVTSAPPPMPAPVPAPALTVTEAPVASANAAKDKSPDKSTPSKKAAAGRDLTIDDLLRRSPGKVPAAQSAPPAAVTAATTGSTPVNAPASAAPHPSTKTGGLAAFQLASVDDQAKAQAMTHDLQHRYAAQLGGVALGLARADLGSRGVHYRIQSPAMATADAERMCDALKQSGAGCILVRK